MAKENKGHKHGESKVKRQKRLKSRSDKNIAKREKAVARTIQDHG